MGAVRRRIGGAWETPRIGFVARGGPCAVPGCSWRRVAFGRDRMRLCRGHRRELTEAERRAAIEAGGAWLLQGLLEDLARRWLPGRTP